MKNSDSRLVTKWLLSKRPFGIILGANESTCVGWELFREKFREIIQELEIMIYVEGSVGYILQTDVS